jgi:hypothetical protein
LQRSGAKKGVVGMGSMACGSMRMFARFHFLMVNFVPRFSTARNGQPSNFYIENTVETAGARVFVNPAAILGGNGSIENEHNLDTGCQPG